MCIRDRLNGQKTTNSIWRALLSVHILVPLSSVWCGKKVSRPCKTKELARERIRSTRLRFYSVSQNFLFTVTKRYMLTITDQNFVIITRLTTQVKVMTNSLCPVLQLGVSQTVPKKWFILSSQIPYSTTIVFVSYYLFIVKLPVHRHVTL